MLGVRQRSAVGAKIEGILGVNRVVTEEKSQKRKRALELGKVFEADQLGVPTSPEIPPIPPLSLQMYIVVRGVNSNIRTYTHCHNIPYSFIC